MEPLPRIGGWLTLILTLLWLGAPVLSAQTEQPAGDTLLLENEYLQARIDPKAGGSLVSLVVKTSRSVKGSDRSVLAGPSFQDAYLFPVRLEQSLAEVPFAAKRLEDGPGRSGWELVADLPEGGMTLQQQQAALANGEAKSAMAWNPQAVINPPRVNHIRLTKRYLLDKDQAALRVQYQLQNTGQVPMQVCLASQVALKPEPGRLALGTNRGLLQVPMPLDAKTRTTIPAFESGPVAWFYDLPAAWLAIQNRQGHGVAVSMDPRQISFLRVDSEKAQAQFGRTIQTLAPGQSSTHDAWMIPLVAAVPVAAMQGPLVAGLTVNPPAADALGNPARKQFKPAQDPKDSPAGKLAPALDPLAGMLAQMEQDINRDLKPEYTGPELRMNLSVQSPQALKGQLLIQHKRLGDADWQTVEQPQVELAPDQPWSMPLTLKPKLQGTYVIQAWWIGPQGRQLLLEHPLHAGRAAGLYQPSVAADVQGKVFEDFRYWHVNPKPHYPYEAWWEPSSQVTTPHLTYARPLAGGPLRLATAVTYHEARPVVELAQRIDIKPQTITVGVRGYRNIWKGSYGINLFRSYASIEEIDRLLQFLRQRPEVLLLADVYGDWFPQDLTDEIARLVEQEGMGLVVVNNEQYVGALESLLQRADKKHGLPWNTPARAARVGKGRVVVYDGKVCELSGSWIRGDETSYDDLARMLLWAGRGDKTVTIDPVALPSSINRDSNSNPVARFRFKVGGNQAFVGQWRYVLRHNLEMDYPFYNQVEPERRPYASWEDGPSASVEVKLAAGSEQVVDCPLPSLSAGNWMLDASLLDAKGAIVDWRRYPCKVSADFQFGTITLQPEQGSAHTIDLAAARDGRSLLFASPVCGQLSIQVQWRSKQAIESLLVNATDANGRVLDQIIQPVSGAASAKLSLSLAAAVHRLAVVKIIARDDKQQPVAEARLLAVMPIPAQRQHLFRFGTYSECSTMDRTTTGYDVRFGGGGYANLLAHAWHDMTAETYGSWLPPVQGQRVRPEDAPPPDPTLGLDQAVDLRLVDQVDALLKGPVKPEPGTKTKPAQSTVASIVAAAIRKPCLIDPAWRKPALEDLANQYRQASLFGPFRGFLVDEWSYYKEVIGQDSRRSFIPVIDANICRCPHCMQAFRQFLRQLYGDDLAALNKQWGTDFAQWDKVEPYTFTDNATPPPADAWPRIIDHRQFIDYQTGQLYRDAAAAVKAVDPQCQVGVSGMWKVNIWNGTDIYQIAPHAEDNPLYRDHDMWYSFTGRSNMQWTGYGSKYNPDRERQRAWSGLFQGQGGPSYYGKSLWAMHRSDHTFHLGPLGLFQAMHEIRDNGLDHLLLNRVHMDPVALFYDPRSLYLGQLQDWLEDPKTFRSGMRNSGRSYNDFVYSVSGSYQSMLAQRAIQPYWVPYAKLHQGQWGLFGKPKVLILPYGQCISDQQAKLIEQFVLEGGTLVGDVQTGRFTEHGARRDQGVLDHLFGIRQPTGEGMRVRQDAKAKLVPVRFGQEFGQPFEMTFAAVGPAGLQALTAKPLAQYQLDGKPQPAFLVNQAGKGRTIFLNFLPTGFQALKLKEVTDTNVDQADQQFLSTQESAQVFARVFDHMLRITQLDERIDNPPSLNLRQFSDGRLRYLAAYVSYSNLPAQQATHTVKLPRKYHLYDVRDGQYLGEQDHIEVRFERDRDRMHRIYALLPYQVQGIDLRKLGTDSLRAGRTFSFEAALNPATDQRHVLRVDVVDPQGQVLSACRQFLTAENGKSQGRVDLAYSDPAGNWRLRVTDVATGVKQELPFAVQAPAP